MPDKYYDVFLSYNSEDLEAVEKIAVYLEDRAGLRPWLDKWALIPGEPWQRRVEQGLERAGTLAVFLGKSGPGPWQEKEAAAALDRQARDGVFRVIPVRLPGTTASVEAFPFLSGNMWIQFKREEDNDALWLLEAGIRGIPSGRGRPEDHDRPSYSRVEPPPHVDPSDLIQPGGAMDVDSRFYIRRLADEDVFDAIQRPRCMVTLRGPRQTGKTSLILKTYVNAQPPDVGVRPLFVDLQSFSSEDFASLNAIWRAVAVQMAAQLWITEWDPELWDAGAGHDRNLSRFLDRFVFMDSSAPVLLCLDEVDRVFSGPVKSGFFASIRAFWTRGAFDASWKGVRWLLSASSEPAFFVEDINQSPFNIGSTVNLNTFTPEGTADFAGRHGLSLDRPMIDRITEYLGGRPYLVHLLFHHMALDRASRDSYMDPKIASQGIFLAHLKLYLAQFQQEPDLAAAMNKVIRGEGCRDVRMADRLEAAGLARSDPKGKVICACGLYRDFFSRKLKP